MCTDSTVLCTIIYCTREYFVQDTKGLFTINNIFYNLGHVLGMEFFRYIKPAFSF